MAVERSWAKDGRVVLIVENADGTFPCVQTLTGTRFVQSASVPGTDARFEKEGAVEQPPREVTYGS